MFSFDRSSRLLPSISASGSLIKDLISHSGRFGQILVYSRSRRRSSPVKVLFDVHVSVSGGRQLCSLLYPVYQLHHVYRVNAE